MGQRLKGPPPPRPGQPDWSKLQRGWPNAQASQFWHVADTHWHIQRAGEGPTVLLIHGTGAATHSWAGLFPLLAHQFDTIAIDLPGQGFTRPSPRFTPTLTQMSGAIGALLDDLEIAPDVLIGHSAGAAIAVRLVADGHASPARIVSLNGALRPFPGLLKHLAPGIAKTLTFGGVAANLFSQAASDRKRVERLLGQTGGAPDADYISLYQSLLKCSAHVSATLDMMANWDLNTIEQQLAALDVPILFLAGATDSAVSPAEAPRLSGIAPQGSAARLSGLGHLAHEQDPVAVMAALRNFLPSVAGST